MALGFNNVPNLGQTIVDNLVSGSIGGILSTRQQAKYASGARTILRINGKISAFAFGVSWKIITGYRELTAIDNTLPEELLPQRIHVDGTISLLHMPGWGVGVQLWQPDALNFLFFKYITIEVRDSATNELLFYAPRAVITTRQEDIKVDQLAQVSLSFLAIGFRDENDPAQCAGIDDLPKDRVAFITALGDPDPSPPTPSTAGDTTPSATPGLSSTSGSPAGSGTEVL